MSTRREYHFDPARPGCYDLFSDLESTGRRCPFRGPFGACCNPGVQDTATLASPPGRTASQRWAIAKPTSWNFLLAMLMQTTSHHHFPIFLVILVVMSGARSMFLAKLCSFLCGMRIFLWTLLWHLAHMAFLRLNASWASSPVARGR